MTNPRKDEALLNRRQFLQAVAAAALVAGIACDKPQRGVTPETIDSGPPLASDPFTLGVASGDPLSDRVILWTRLAPKPLDGGGMPSGPVVVGWQIARDEAFRDVVRSGSVTTLPEFGHSAHVDASGLQPNSWYFYRFFTTDWISPVGRTRTMPLPQSDVERLTIGIACCQNYTDGYFVCHAHLAAEKPDLLLFLGDYIYEGGSSPSDVRQHSSGEILTLDAYRERYAQYKMDRQLQESHLACPWLVIWDDHEVDNDYMGELSEDRELLGERRKAAYQAFYEHMPVRLEPPTASGALEIYRAFRFGRLVQFNLTDTRQHRSDPNCGTPSEVKICTDGTILGESQMSWLLEQLTTSDALWNTLVTSVVFADVTFSGVVVNPDQWDAYEADRQRVLQAVETHAVPGFMALSGDLHIAGFAVLKRNPRDPNGKVLGAEIVTNSITSGGTNGAADARLVVNAAKLFPHIRYAYVARRGYSLCTITPDEWTVHYRIVETVDSPTAALSTHTTWRVTRSDLGVEQLDVT